MFANDELLNVHIASISVRSAVKHSDNDSVVCALSADEHPRARSQLFCSQDALDLLEVISIVTGDVADEALHRDLSALGVHTGALPLLRR
jgi:hypothetical protein